MDWINCQPTNLFVGGHPKIQAMTLVVAFLPRCGALGKKKERKHNAPLL